MTGPRLADTAFKQDRLPDGTARTQEAPLHIGESGAFLCPGKNASCGKKRPHTSGESMYEQRNITADYPPGIGIVKGENIRSMIVLHIKKYNNSFCVRIFVL